MSDTVNQHELSLGSEQASVPISHGVMSPMARVLQQLQCFLAYADEVELDNDTVQDLLEIDVEEDDDPIAEDLAIERVVDMTSLYSTLEGGRSYLFGLVPP
jgi:hypothetical protein